MASAVHNSIVAQQALRAIEELNARAGGHAAALASLRAIAGRFAAAGNVAEQILTVMSMLDPLVALGAYEVAATICGPWPARRGGPRPAARSSTPPWPSGSTATATSPPAGPGPP